MDVLTDWRALEAAHGERAATLTAARRARAPRGLVDPVEDFLWDYYAVRPRDLARWHPGEGLVLADDGVLGWRERARWAHRVDGGVALDVAAYLADRGDAVARAHRLLAAVAGREGRFACFGWHEWAMVYRQGVHRHPLPLRLGQEGTDTVLEAARVACSHFDAVRFFTPPAVGLNRMRPTWENRVDLEQPACLHANMDLFRLAHTLGPACPGDLLLDTFELALAIRRLDMAASPYDCRRLGLEPVAVETPEGRAEYAAAQRAFAARAAPLRDRLLALTSRLLRPGADAAHP